MSNEPKIKRNNDNIIGYLFILPLIIYFIVFQLAPMLMALGISFTDWNMRSELNFIGFKNYIDLFTDGIMFPNFWKSLVVTLKYILMSVPLSIFITLVVSALLNSKIKGEGIFKTIFYIPGVTASVAVAAVWLFMLDSQYGLFNKLLKTNIAFLADKRLALPTIVVMSIWSGLGYNVLIMLSAMKNVNPALYEAADLDGAGKIKQFFSITIPCIMPNIFFLVITSIIGSFQVFDQMYLMTGGGPEGSTLSYMLELYKQAFEYNNMGVASAMSYILFFIILIITFIQFKVMPQNLDEAKEGK